jgi:hypothetical protein
MEASDCTGGKKLADQPSPHPKTSVLPVLGLFSDEAELCAHLAADIGLVENGLEFLAAEYALKGEGGAGGRIDLLAKDKIGHIVCIEVKRSDRSARETVNELCKYVTLLIERDRVQRENIRCMVVSTHWHELQLPLSYFAATAGVDVRGLEASAAEGTLVLGPRRLDPPNVLPQLSPEIECLSFADVAGREAYLNHVHARVQSLPFLRIAIVLLEIKPGRGADRDPFMAIVAIWRILDRDLPRLEKVLGEQMGALEPYAFSGWEAECDAQEWVCSDEAPGVLARTASERRGTAEKIENLLSAYHPVGVQRVGDWPKLGALNDDESVIQQMLARSPASGAARGNRQSFEALTSAAVKPSFDIASSRFFEFISFEPAWVEAALQFIKTWSGEDVQIAFHAYDKKHFFYAIHQARTHTNAALSCFAVLIQAGDEVVAAMRGGYGWDGKTAKSDASSNIEKIYGSLSWAVVSMLSATDEQRYEDALAIHGFRPYVDIFDSRGGWSESDPALRRTLQDFMGENEDYSAEVSEVFQAFGIPTTQPND